MSVDLDSILFYWDLAGTAPCRLRDACEGIFCLGATGGGKTSGFGELVAPALVGHPGRFGGLILTAKGSDRDLWVRYAREAGREQDLMIFSLKPGDKDYSYNFLADPAIHDSPGGMVFNLVALFETVIKSLEKGTGRSAESPFWRNSLRLLLRMCIILVRAARQDVSLADLHELVVSSPRDPRQVANWEALEARQNELSPEELETLRISKEWHSTSFCCAIISDAIQQAQTEQEAQDVAHAADYFLKTWPILPPETRESVVATFQSTVDSFLTGDLRALMTRETNISPTCCFDGKLILIDLPVLVYQDLGVLVATIFKYAFQLATQAREMTPESRPVFLWADEAHLTLTPNDGKFQSVARSHLAITVYLTQSLDAFYESLGVQHPHQAKVAVDSLAGNLNTKVFLMNTSSSTNTWSANLVGRDYSWEAHSYGENSSSQFGSQQGWSMGDGDNMGVQRIYRYQIEPVEFTRLKRGGPDRQVEAIVFQGGREFPSTRRNFMRTIFEQPLLSDPAKKKNTARGHIIRCPHCNAELRLGQQSPGAVSRCPNCNGEFQIPSPLGGN